MRLFICEFITGGGLQGEELPANLKREGDMMLTALLSDLQDAGMDNLLTTRDPRLHILSGKVKMIIPGDNAWDTWRKCMKESDAAWLIAPETDGVLHRLTLIAQEQGCKIIGCSPEAVELTTSKSRTINYLSGLNIPCVPAWTDVALLPDSRAGWVIKPDDGVGAEGCFYFKSIKSLRDYVNNLKGDAKYIVQKFVAGIPASVSFLCYQGDVLILSCNQQLFEFIDGKGHFKGVIVNGLRQYVREFETIAKSIAGAVKGLTGYIGVDLIVTDSGPVVVEINPRLTTAYAGLRRSLGRNPAEWILALCQTGRFPELHGVNCSPVTIKLE